MDSCNDIYVLAGTPNMYSKPRLLMTSTMKSEPGLSMVFASSTTRAAGAAAGRARTGALAFLVAGAGSWAPAAPGLVTARAALAAAVFKKFRRSTDLVFGFFAMNAHLAAGFYAVGHEKAIFATDLTDLTDFNPLNPLNPWPKNIRSSGEHPA